MKSDVVVKALGGGNIGAKCKRKTLLHRARPPLLEEQFITERREMCRSFQCPGKELRDHFDAVVETETEIG